MTESEFYQREVKPLLKRMGVFFYRVEHKRIPDIYVAKHGNSLWIELKCVNKKSPIVKPDWRVGQLSWIKEHKKLGGDNVCLLLKYEGKRYFLFPKEFYYEKELICQKDYFLRKLKGDNEWKKML